MALPGSRSPFAFHIRSTRRALPDCAAPLQRTTLAVRDGAVAVARHAIKDHLPKEMKMSLEEIMKQMDQKSETLQGFRDGELWYRTRSGSEYAVPMTYRGDSAYQAQENLVHLIR
ncbi:hypothetical protein [Noviherbaspirillum galbum]|uniref:Uncharacterized protein n=1 Tax=Noviherbaspirillum galbum TaxID=2709383 RepID=A0A6B3STX9_9BURK|nr:hypothetical protein [Noviherbaspirillum galbum]NEX63918.1 hypothetical protein [Noviherbaspirillum galbum]